MKMLILLLLRCVASASSFALLLLVLVGCSSASQNTFTGDTLRHENLHLAITKPATWRYLTPKEKRDARHANTYGNKLYDSLVKLEAFPPRIVIAKYSEPHRGINPRVSVDRYPLDDLRFKTSEWLAHRIYRNYQYYFDGVTFEIPFRQVTIGGKTAMTFRVRYTLEVKDSLPHVIDEQFWVVATGITAYLVTGRCASNGPEAAFEEINSVVASLKFD
jgi:hypothetical protein